jgi:hypothetical protein
VEDLTAGTGESFQGRVLRAVYIGKHIEYSVEAEPTRPFVTEPLDRGANLARQQRLSDGDT